ncbi:MAG: hypothetical protein V1244_01535 [Nitrospinaceae bacterium]|nr:hypothetical protein [Nitrospinaceae bacterium]
MQIPSLYSSIHHSQPSWHLQLPTSAVTELEEAAEEEEAEEYLEHHHHTYCILLNKKI